MTEDDVKWSLLRFLGACMVIGLFLMALIAD